MSAFGTTRTELTEFIPARTVLQLLHQDGFDLCNATAMNWVKAGRLPKPARKGWRFLWRLIEVQAVIQKLATEGYAHAAK
jgi:hypothetical protein